MSKTRRALICILLLCGTLPLMAATHKQRSRVKSTESHRITPHTPARPDCDCGEEAPYSTYLPLFFDTPSYRGAAAPAFAAAVDSNFDGKLDLFAGRGVLLGYGDGTFREGGGVYWGTPPPIAMTTGYFNNDSKLDVALVGGSPSESFVEISLGNGGGSFAQGVGYSLGGIPDAVPGSELVVVGDFNSDGNLDLAAVNTETVSGGWGTGIPWSASPDGSIRVLLGNGDGTFHALVDFPAGHLPTALVAGDFSGDGKTDLAVAQGHDGQVSVMLGNGDGTFQAGVSYLVSNAVAIAVASLTGNGTSDLIATCSDVTVRVLLGNGDGTFQPAVAYGTIPVRSGSNAPVFSDFNGDGKLDMAFVSGIGDSVGTLFGNGDGTFGEEQLFGTELGPLAVVAADFNADGKVDLATDNGNVLLGNGDGTFQARLDYRVQGAVSAAAFTDFNHDGNIDLAATSCNFPNCTGATVSILQGNGTGSFGPPESYAVGTGASAIAFGDFNKDGVLDAVTGNFTTGSSNALGISVLLGSKDGTFQASTDYSGAQVPNTNDGFPPKDASVAVADLNGDGNPDIVATGAGLGLLVWLGNADGTFQQPKQQTDVGGGSSALIVGDFDGDGKPDVAVTNGTRFTKSNGQEACDGSTLSLLLGQGDGTFGAPASFETVFAPESLAVGDFNGDGKLDLVVVGNGQYEPLVLDGPSDVIDSPRQRRRHIPEAYRLDNLDRGAVPCA